MERGACFGGGGERKGGAGGGGGGGGAKGGGGCKWSCRQKVGKGTKRPVMWKHAVSVVAVCPSHVALFIYLLVCLS